MQNILQTVLLTMAGIAAFAIGLFAMLVRNAHEQGQQEL